MYGVDIICGNDCVWYLKSSTVWVEFCRPIVVWNDVLFLAHRLRYVVGYDVTGIMHLSDMLILIDWLAVEGE